ERNSDRFEIVAVTACTNAEALADIARRTKEKRAVLADESRLTVLRELLSGTDCRCAGGAAALKEAASGDAELVIAAIVGCAGLVAGMAAVEGRERVALANKEALVTSAQLMTQAAGASGANLLPV